MPVKNTSYTYSISYINILPAPIQHKGLWPTVGYLVQTNATRGSCTGIFPTSLLVYRRAIYPQKMTSKYGLGGRLASAHAQARF